MSRSLHSAGVVLALTAAGVATHLIPHGMGVSTVGAISILAAAWLPGRLLPVPVLVTVLVSDVVHGGYSLAAMGVVYAAYLAAAGAAATVIGRVRAATVLVASIVNAVVFYLVSNVVPMAMGYYPFTMDGWLTCYFNGLPFLWRGVLANLVFASAGFALVHAVRQLHAHRLAAAQRY